MILELKTEMRREDIDRRLQNFFESKGYESQYKGEYRVCRTSLWGNCCFEVLTNDRDIKIAAWTEPSIIKINTGKKRLEKDVLALKQLFADAGGLTEAENELKGPEYHVVTYDLKEDTRKYAHIAIFVVIVTAFIPMSVFFGILTSLLALSFGIKGRKSSSKAASICGIVLPCLTLTFWVIEIGVAMMS